MPQAILIDEIPTRLVLMLTDADERTKQSYTGFIKKYDPDIDLPCWEIGDGGGDYALSAANITQPVDTFTANLIVAPYGQGMEDDETRISEFETLARAISYNALLYCLQRPDLLFSNLRGIEDGSLAPLNGVMFAKIRREPAGLYGTDGEGFGKFWGSKLIFSVTTQVMVRRVHA